MKVAILASGNGTNFEILAKKFESNELAGKLALLFCDHPDAPVVKRAEKYQVPVRTFTVKECGGKLPYEERIMKILKEFQIDFIVLAGYLRVIGPTILQNYEGKIVNLHPAYLPEYPGLHSIERAFADHRKQTGVTVHFVDDGLDSGPIIRQEHVPILSTDTVETLEQRVHECEHRLYPQVIKEILPKFTKKEQN
ncbi:phosphoribosylglycinamide formyltransferase [Liquorilactobacillus sucicola DSM 21376 = JCM 15457]|uniref:Phosphoribosylglycinamide formyltransferase n=1 Tax=Liquorilactobacillus sucicola DSM 21376 = JCM 15457 TaxID=1423806 RepID=A0A023CUL0_9LACO|nr:phosphoribosylglycinamide formyltransferase [Liquorilactobacillus sucicola]KRN05137.1 phosphoribosylglycinamide formyltransferase [Liquorilactobacillus sucicola DSM 21376 = JCM 15457]GAJ25185.1 phosphoribosylglycinamide formyltransferase [Liquorilactobacillus sucicola DSM 21376 = JCM 15457]